MLKNRGDEYFIKIPPSRLLLALGSIVSNTSSVSKHRQRTACLLYYNVTVLVGMTGTASTRLQDLVLGQKKHPNIIMSF